MQFIDLMDNIFSKHSFLSIAFSGFGIALISAIVYIARKILASHKHSNSQTPISKTETTIISPQAERTINFPQIESDIKAIEHSIKFDLSSNQKNVFLRYFNKYKINFNKSDIESLDKQSTIFSPDYSSLLSQLLGLIEALNGK